MQQLEKFIYERIPDNLYYHLRREFKERAKFTIDEAESGFLNFWLYFFYRYENGMRGIEWFLTEKGQRLPEEELAMAKRWAELRPKMVQAIEKTDSSIIFFRLFFKRNISGIYL